ncbi:hypothetical protein ACA910_020925 [Epithemia clementina (nom. ined.)]
MIRRIPLASFILGALCVQTTPAFTVVGNNLQGRLSEGVGSVSLSLSRIQQRCPVISKKQQQSAYFSPSFLRSKSTTTNDDTKGENESVSCWNPKLRRVMGAIASAGAVETAYLTWSKFSNNNNNLLFCGADTGGSSGCSSVLDGPYAVIPGTDVPLSLVGFIAYTTVALLALVPMFCPQAPNEGNSNNDDTLNRLLLSALSTSMGFFSLFLMAVLFGVLKEPCAFCVASAVFSVTLAKLSWLGGAVPSERIKQGIQWSATGSGIASLAASVLLFTSAFPGDFTSNDSMSSVALGSPSSQVLLASTEASNPKGNVPPPILSSSSPRALAISRDLQLLNARMFGAYWCSHCYDQKERLGKEAMLEIPYIECSREGFQSQSSLCKQRDVPGYPTWEINGNLYPGEKELDELEDIIRETRR